MLEQLERANLFLVPLDDRRTWYRYHHLFADVLRARLLDEQPELVAELHRRASDWYEANGDRAEAIAPRHGRRALRTGRGAHRAGRPRDAPAPPGSHAPALARSAARRGLPRPAGAHHHAGRAPGWPPATPPASSRCSSWWSRRWNRSAPPPIVFDHDEFARLPAQLAVYRAALALLAGDIDGTIAHATRVLDLVEPTDHLRRGSAHRAAGTRALDHRRPRARRSAATPKPSRSLIAADHLPDMLGCSLALADIQIAQGRLGDATRTFESGLRWTTEHPGLRGAADMHVGLSEVLIERNDLDAAARHLQASTELGEHAGLPQHAYRWRVATARLRHARGDLDGALDLLDEAAPLYDTDFSPPVRPVAALRARVQLARGDLDAARRWAADRGLTRRRRAQLRPRVRAHHLRPRAPRPPRRRARRRLARGRDHAAGPTARGGRGRAPDRQHHRDPHAAGDRPPRPRRRRGRGRRAGGCASTSRTRGLRPRSSSTPARPWRHSCAPSPRGQAEPHARRVLAAADARRPPRPTSPGLVDELSARELDVLRLLRSDLSGPDIARELLVSLNTFRTHTKNIYAKLGVNNRREAIRRAAELGL